jgi:hypothetical protein
VSGPVRLRVTVHDAWDTVVLDADPSLTMAQVKAEALARATGRTLTSGDYVVKYRGALVLDEQQTVGALALPSGAPLIVLPARRQPVR